MRFHCALLTLMALTLTSCGEVADPNLKPVFPVKGTVTVDGTVPDAPIKITVHDEKGMDPNNPTMSWSLTKPDGSFALSTYVDGDGVPEGKYSLTFFWGTWNAVSMSFGGKDKLNERYDTVEKSPVEFSVDGSGPVDLGTIELTTK